jgi:CotH kinase protein
MKTAGISLILCLCLTMCNNSQKTAVITTPASKNIALVTIETKQEIEDDPKINGTIKITLNDSLLVSSPIGIELRGAVSLQADKKSYGFELRKENGDAQEMSLLGMAKDDDWVLHGPMADRSMIRNSLAYAISNQMGRYAAKSSFVELKVNGDFKGLYLLMEKLKRNDDKIKIAKLAEETTTGDDLTGGYILKIDKTAGKNGDWTDYNPQNSFHSGFDENGKPSESSVTHYLFEYPKAKHITAPQKTYIEQYVAGFEKGMASKNPAENAATIEKYMDLGSFVDYFILTEWMQNNDGYRISTFMQKDKNGKLAMGPIWDCDLAFGPEQSFCGPMSQDNWVYKYNQFCGDDAWLVPFWWTKLTQSPAFKKAVLARWQELRKNTLSDKNILTTIQEQADFIQQNKLIDRNYERWSGSKQERDFQKRHQKHIEKVKTWTIKHAAWIDRNIINL